MKAQKPFTSESQRYEYPLKPESVVFDGGGYHGQWAKEIAKKYGCQVHCFEPVYPLIVASETSGYNVKVVNAGLGAFSRKAVFAIQENSSGAFGESEQKVEVDIVGIDEYLLKIGNPDVDLLKLNVEGMEYEILDELCGSGQIRKFKRIQVQFHGNVPEVNRRLEHLLRSIDRTHRLEWGEDPFIWMSFTLKTEFESRSQCGQDEFAWEVSGRKKDGTFLDIGASDAVVINNTYALEQIGWIGHLFDISDAAQKSAIIERTSPFHLIDVTNPAIAGLIPSGWIDYLSLDVDAASLDALKALPLYRTTFGAITIEHDAYRFGGGYRKEMREILQKAGYKLVCSNISDQGMPFEDWWCHPSRWDEAQKFACDDSDWKKAFAWKQ